MRVTCPKCLSESARYERDHQDVTLRCRCGFLKVVATRLEEIVIEHIESVSLPKRGTNLWSTLTAVAALETATTQQITEHINGHSEVPQTSSDISTQLTILRYKGVVCKLESKRGAAGGSTWILTEKAKRLLGV